MVGVVVNALGMEQMFASLDAGGSPDVGVMVLGYVVMRTSMVFLWGQVARQDPGRAPAAHTSMWTIGFAQVGWLSLALLGPSIEMFVPAGMALFALETGGPGSGAAEESHSLGGEVLERHRERSYLWSGGHLLIFGAIAATGAGLHVAAYYLEGDSALSSIDTVFTVAVPLAVFVVSLFAIGSVFLRQHDPFHLLLIMGTAGVLVLSVILAGVGMSMAWCLVVLTLAPGVFVIGYETVGPRHLVATLLAD